MLEARAVRNVSARVTDETADRLSVWVRSLPPRYMVPPISWIVPRRKERRFVLDRLGSEVWRLCDGRRNVEAVIDAFASEHELTFHEARVAVTSYIRSLVKRGVLAVAMPEVPKG
jgi:hypothetical protein